MTIPTISIRNSAKQIRLFLIFIRIYQYNKQFFKEIHLLNIHKLETTFQLTLNKLWHDLLNFYSNEISKEKNLSEICI